jgi:hypothetical protein
VVTEKCGDQFGALHEVFDATTMFVLLTLEFLKPPKLIMVVSEFASSLVKILCQELNILKLALITSNQT